MRLNLLFIVMDLLTFMAYPFVFIYGILHHFWKAKVRITVPKPV